MEDTLNETRREVLEKILQDEEDPYWYDVFKDLLKDKTPRGVKTTSREIFSLMKGKEFSILFEDEDFSEKVKDVFTRLFGYHSPEDRKALLKDDTCRQKVDTWNETKKKSVKDSLILAFVSKEGTRHGLDMNMKRKLYFIINSSLIFKTITADDFKMNNGEIESIDDLVIENGSFRLLRSIPAGKKTYKNTRRMVAEAKR